MDNIISYKNKSPNIDGGAYINPYAIVIGDVTIAEGVSLWPGVIIRADDESVEIGVNTAILDRVLVESPRGTPVIIGENVLVSHGAILHGCTIGSGALIGISSNILDGVEIGAESVIAASALITAGTSVPPRSKVMGMPGKITGEVSEQEIQAVQEERMRIMDKAKEYGNWFVAKQL